MLDIREPDDRTAGLHIIVDIVKDFGDAARCLGRHRRLIYGFDGSVEQSFAGCFVDLDDCGLERQFVGACRKRQECQR